MGENTFEISKGLSLLFQSPADALYWFGYYNYCPISVSGNKLLAHKWEGQEERPFNASDTIEVGWFDLKDSSWHHVATTDACNWQQGAMSQWLSIDGEERIIFNKGENGKYISCIYNTDGTLYKKLPAAIYGINQEKLFSITINFERAHWCRCYHYESIQDETLNKGVTEVDGIYRLDLNTGALKKIIDIDTIIHYDYQEEFAGAKHWVEHIMLNPSGTRFSFYHRFDTGTGFQTRCFTANVDGADIYMVPDWKKNSWSHLGWRNDREFVLFGIKRRTAGNVYSAVTMNSGKLGQFARKVYRALVAPFVTPQIHNKIAASSNYQYYEDGVGLKGKFETGRLVHDGHPSFTKDGRFMLTDTYGDEENYRHLLLFDVEKNVLHELGKFYSPINATGYRSDLHPRFGRNESSIIIDTAHTGHHGLYVFNINWDVFTEGFAY